MNIVIRSLVLLGVSLMMVACTSTTKNVEMTDRVSFGAEEHEVWNRPLEVGFEMGDKEIEATDSDLQILPIFSFLDGFFGEDNLTQSAIFEAIKANKVDGMYITATKREESGFWPFYAHTEVSVYGKPLKIKTVGQVSEKRADALRMGD